MNNQIIYDILAGNDYTVEELGDIKAQDTQNQALNSEDRELTFSDYITQI